MKKGGIVTAYLFLILVSSAFISALFLGDSPVYHITGRATEGTGSGLQLWLKFDDAISDGVATDSSGQGNNGICSGTACPIYLATGGKSGGAYQFDGVNDLINAGTKRLGINTTKEFTISAWIKIIKDGPADYDVILSRSSYIRPFRIDWYQNKLRFSIRNSTKVYYFNSPSNSVPIDNKWKHVAFTRDKAGSVKMYLNGALSTQGIVTGNLYFPSGEKITIGSLESGSYFNGALDELRIYSRALSASEIQALYGGTTPAPPSCTPATCSSLGYNCETHSDGCNGTIECGNCPSGQSCSDGKCITAPSDALKITSTPVTTVNEGAKYEYNLYTTDPTDNLWADQDWFLIQAPSWLSLDREPGGEIMGWINGTAPLVERNTDYPITVKVLDTQTRLSDTQSYNLTVIDSDSQKISVEMTLSTIKDNYTIGEVVELTDPPADVVSANADNNERVYSRYDSYETPSERVIAKTDFFSTSEPTPEFQGYIIEFEEETLVEKYVKLKQEAEKNKDRVASQIAGFVLPKSLEPALPSNIESKIVRERTKIKTARETFKQRALQRLGKRQIITGHAIDESQLLVLGEYENTFNGIALNISSEEAEQIEQVPGVKEVYPNYPVKVALMDSVPLINADDVWKLDSTGGNCATSGKPCLTGKGVTIGIIDTGVDYTHPDLGGCIGANCKVVGGYDFVNGDSNPMDDQGHGTHVAATAAGNGVLKGVAPDAKIYAYKVMNQKGEGDVSNIIKAIERTVDPNQDGNFADHLDIISLSLGIGCKYYFGEYSENCGPDDPMSKAIDSAVSAGVVAVVAAGNDGDFGEGSVGSPGTARKAITVGAVYSKDYSGSYWQDYNPKKDSIVSFSSRGPVIWSNGSIIKPDIVAPGALICAARYDSIYPEGRHPYYKPCLDERHVLLAGTSMATPNVAGVVALLKQKNPAWTPEEIKMALRSTAKDLGYDTNSQGYGRVDILNAANLKGVPSVVKIDTSGIVSGKINIIGTASGREFKNYTLYYKTGDSAEWIKLKTSTTPLNNGILYSSFDTGLLAEDELSYLKLASWNSKGEKSEDNCLITANNFRMISPLSRDILRKGDLVKIKGIIPYNIKKLIVYSAEGVYFNTDQLKNANWKLLKTTSSILGGSVERELATWDTTTLNDGFHNLKIEVETEFSNITEFIYPLFLDSRIKKGWPIYLDMGESGSQIANEGYQPEVDDLDNDGKKEIIFVQTTIGHPPILRLMAYNYSGGIKWYKDLPETHPQGIISTQKTIGDLDNDGKKEIFVVYECNLNYDHFIHRFRYNGEEYLGNGWPMKLDTNDPYTLTIADLNGDAVSELIAYGGTVQTPEGDFNNILSFIGNAGKIRDILIPRCELFKTNQIYAPSASVGNFDEDENLEVAVRIGCNGIGLYNFDGSSVDGWPTYISGFIWGGRFSIGDIDGDTNSEIVVPAVSLTNTSNNELLYEGGIYVLNKSGGLLPGWPFNALKSFVSPVALGDLNNDDKLEIVAQYSGGKRDKLILNYGGEIISGWPKRFQPEFGYTPLSSAPVITDVNGDSKNDVIFNDGGFSSKIYEGRVGALGGLMAYNLNGSPIKLGINDEIMPFILLDMSSRENSPVITDLENNKKTDIVIGLPLEAKDRIILYAFELNAPYNPLTAEWPTFMHDPQHTGCYDCGPKATPPTRPKSQILNKGSANIQGYLLMRVQKKQTRGGWANVRTIVNDTKTSTLRTVPAVAALGLDTIWKNAGAYKTTGTGTFRVYAALTDSKGKVLTDSTGKPLNATAQFRVI